MEGRRRELGVSDLERVEAVFGNPDLYTFMDGVIDRDPTRGGRPLLYFAGWKRHISLYPAPAGDEALERRLAPYRSAKSTLKFPLSRPVPYDLIAQVAELSLRRLEDGGSTG